MAERGEVMGKNSQFIGVSIRNLDAKNRIAMPPKFKDVVGNKPIIITIIPGDLGLRVYLEDDFDEILDNYYVNDGVDRSGFQSRLFNYTEKSEVDNHSRFVIDKRLCEKVGIDKEVKMVGTGRRIGLWNPEVYEKVLTEEMVPELEVNTPF